MDELWIELLLSVVLLLLFFLFLAWLNRKGYKQNLECLRSLAKNEGLQVYESPTGGSLFGRAQFEAQYNGSTVQYAYLRGGWHGFDLSLHSIRRRGRPFATRLTLRWTAAQAQGIDGVLLLCPKGSLQRYAMLKLSPAPLTGELAQHFELLADNTAWALQMLDDKTRQFLIKERHYLRGPLFLSAKMLYTEEADLLLNAPQVAAVKERLRILLQLAYFWQGA